MRNTQKRWWSVLVLTVGGLAQGVAAIEQPGFEVTEEIGDLEIRRYEQHIVARTLVGSPFKEAGNEGFRRLAGYIFGDNDLDQKIAMTAPVGLTAESQEKDDEQFWVTFSMPAEYGFDELPEPDDARVQVETVATRYLAVLPYRGNWSEKRYRKHEAKLLSLLENVSTWRIAGEPTWARYDPPFMPGFMRSNEVAIEVVPIVVGQ
ncbi:MAG: heme-binding protein [Gammaproteobacteria bacterium]|nr:heme-binding protein [Gammaproteobacteria bacterium]MBT5203434.1 heme-binding protein [Gammaproteobacteria bacterium]MBT5602668.1 heme-binding protein [Gammaproteobacteria bacterium]MBT6245459.1 heme-binding protein [Gammaproteobacteria bacterium]